MHWKFHVLDSYTLLQYIFQKINCDSKVNIKWIHERILLNSLINEEANKMLWPVQKSFKEKLIYSQFDKEVSN